MAPGKALSFQSGTQGSSWPSLTSYPCHHTQQQQWNVNHTFATTTTTITYLAIFH